MAALHETTERVAAEGVLDVVGGVVVVHHMTASTRPGVAEGGERADAHSNAGRIDEDILEAYLLSLSMKRISHVLRESEIYR
jgi:hypothetical protein